LLGERKLDVFKVARELGVDGMSGEAWVHILTRLSIWFLPFFRASAGAVVEKGAVWDGVEVFNALRHVWVSDCVAAR